MWPLLNRLHLHEIQGGLNSMWPLMYMSQCGLNSMWPLLNRLYLHAIQGGLNSMWPLLNMSQCDFNSMWPLLNMPYLNSMWPLLNMPQCDPYSICLNVTSTQQIASTCNTGWLQLNVTSTQCVSMWPQLNVTSTQYCSILNIATQYCSIEYCFIEHSRLHLHEIQGGLNSMWPLLNMPQCDLYSTDCIYMQYRVVSTQCDLYSICLNVTSTQCDLHSMWPLLNRPVFQLNVTSTQ